MFLREGGGGGRGLWDIKLWLALVLTISLPLNVKMTVPLTTRDFPERELLIKNQGGSGYGLVKGC